MLPFNCIQAQLFPSSTPQPYHHSDGAESGPEVVLGCGSAAAHLISAQMPEFNGNELIVLQQQLLELRQKLVVEQNTLEATARIQAKLVDRKHVAQVASSMKESVLRIEFLKEQISELELHVKGFAEERGELNRQESLATTCSARSGPEPFGELDFWLGSSRLSWAKIDYKISELGYRINIAENLLQGAEKMLAAIGQESLSVRNRLLVSRNELKKRVGLLGQALKKYTSLSIGIASTNALAGPSPSTAHQSQWTNNPLPDIAQVDSAAAYTGKLRIKVQSIGNLEGPNAPPFRFELRTDRPAKTSNLDEDGNVLSVIVPVTPVERDSNCYTSGQDILLTLEQSRQIELCVSSGSHELANAIFFCHLGAIFSKGADEEGIFDGTIELEPAGTLGLQLCYIPNVVKKKRLAHDREVRIKRRPVIKRTQHSHLGHELVSGGYGLKLDKCNYCQEFLLSVTGGYQCKICKLVAHKECYRKLYNPCLNWSEDADKPAEDPKSYSTAVLEFTTRYNIPHKQRLVSLAIPSWCTHCGHFVPLGRRVAYRCDECLLVWHDRCDPCISKHHCGLNNKAVEAYWKGISSINEGGKIRHRAKSSISMSTIEELSASLETLRLSSSRSALPLARELFIEDFELIKCIGKGNFGKVMLARYRRNPKGPLYAVKMLKKHSIIENEEFDSVSAEREVFRLAAESDHPFMVHAHAMFQDNKRIYFAMEFVSGGDLMFHIQNNPFSVDSCRFYAAQLVLILEFLHENGILYRDLKLDNVLVGPDGYIKLADYGLCKPGMTEKSLTRTFCGTPEFMAPEILLDQPYSLAVDYWAFGVLLYQMLECRSPFYGNNEKETFQSILRGKLHFSADTDKAGKILITKLLARDPLERLGIKDGRGWTAIREHAFFEGMDWSRLLARQLPSPMLPHTDSPEDVSNFDETFTTEDITLTPYPSLILPKDQSALEKAQILFQAF